MWRPPPAPPSRRVHQVEFGPPAPPRVSSASAEGALQRARAERVRRNRGCGGRIAQRVLEEQEERGERSDAEMGRGKGEAAGEHNCASSADAPCRCCRREEESRGRDVSVAEKIALDLPDAAAPTGVSTPNCGMPRRSVCLGRAQRQRRYRRAEAWPQAWPRRRSSPRRPSRTATVQGGAAHRRSPARRRPRAQPGLQRRPGRLGRCPGKFLAVAQAAQERATPADVPDWAFIPRGDFPATSASARCSTGCCARRGVDAAALARLPRGAAVRHALRVRRSPRAPRCARPPRARRAASSSSFVRGAAPKSSARRATPHARRAPRRRRRPTRGRGRSRACRRPSTDSMRCSSTDGRRRWRGSSEAHFEDCWRARSSAATRTAGW